MNELEKINRMQNWMFSISPLSGIQKYGSCNPGDVIRVLKIPRGCYMLSITRRSVRFVPRRFTDLLLFII